MNGVGQQQTRHQGPGTPGNQMSMYLSQNFPSPHDNYGQMNHPRPNGRPAFVLPQGPTSVPTQRFCPPPAMPMVRNGMPYPATPHTMPPAVLQQSHPSMQQTPGQGEMNVTPMYPGQPQEGTQMDFNTTPVMYSNMNPIFQHEGPYGRQVLMVRYPSYMPQVQLFQTRPVQVQVPNNPVQNPMQPYQPQHAVVMNQQMLQQQQQASEIRQDTSTPQPHHVTQFIPNMGFTPDSTSFYYSPHANIGQPSLMSGQQPLSFTSYIQHGSAPVNQSSIQTPISQGPPKHGTKPYIMYRDEYSRSLQQGVPSGNNSGTLRKEKKTIKIINPNTNEEVDLSAPSKSEVAGAFQKQVKEVADVSSAQTMLIQPTPKTAENFPEERQKLPLDDARADFSFTFYSDQSGSMTDPAISQGFESSLEVCNVQTQGGIDAPILVENFSTPSFHLDGQTSSADVHAAVADAETGKAQDVEGIQFMTSLEDEPELNANCKVQNPNDTELIKEDEENDDNDNNNDGLDDEDDSEGRKRHKRAGKKVTDKRDSDAGKVDLVGSGAVTYLQDEMQVDERPPSPLSEESSVERHLAEGALEATEEFLPEEVEEGANVVETVQTVACRDKESDSNVCDDLDEVILSTSKSESDIIAPQDDMAEIQPPTNGLFRGRRVYSREFLMNLRDCPEAMKKLPTISSDLADIIKPAASFKRESSVGTLSALGMRGAQPMNYSDYALYGRSSSQQNRIPKKPSQKRDYQQPQTQQRIINVALNHEVQLHTSDQAWKPSIKTGDGFVLGGDEDVTQKLYKKTRSVLNKLTPQNFETLLEQIKKLPITTEDRLAGCMDLVFEKAISEPNFCVAYAQMAYNICSMKVPSKEIPTEYVSFRKLLLNRCQSEFEKDKIDELELEKRQKEIDECESEEKKKVLMLEKADTMRKVRRRSLGNIRFIGELFKMKMLTEKIMFDCLTRLMKTEDEDSIECLCWLVRTIGKDLDHSKNKKALDPLFQEISKKSCHKVLSLRTRFMLQDIIELRESNWVPRRVDVNPKTIEQIHKEAQQEELQKQAMINQSPQLINSYPPPIQSQKGGTDNMASRGNRFSGGPRAGQQVSEDGWTTYLTKNVVRGGTQLLDHSKLRLSKQNMDASDIKLGPCRPTTWSHGAGSGSSSGGSQFQSGSRHSSQESEKSSASNRFAPIIPLSESFDYGRQNRVGLKEPNSVPRGHLHRVHAESGYASLPLHRSKNADHSSRPNSGSRNASRESSISREASNRASPVVMSHSGPRQPLAMPLLPTPKETALNKEIFKRKIECLVDEYLSIVDDKEALLSAQELRMNFPMMSDFVYTVINHVIEKSSKELRQTGQLLSHLLFNMAIDMKCFSKGLEEALSDAPDLEIDIPKIWDCYTELLASMLLKCPSLLFPISQAMLCLKSSDKAGSLMAGCMLRVAESQGYQKTIFLWNTAPISWSDFTNRNLFEFMMENKLEQLSILTCDLLRFMNSQVDYDTIFLWINQRIAPYEQKPTFIRSLITAACMASLEVIDGRSEIKNQVFRKYTNLLNRYIDHLPDRETQTLFAIQSLVHSLDHPSNILNNFFHLVYDVELISEDAFHEWKGSNDPNEQNGKGVATAATRPFFQWLQESVEEEDTS